MKLILNSLNAPIITIDNIASLRAEDKSGHFGIHPGHIDFLTVIDTSVVHWFTADGREQYCAVRCGVLRVLSGATITITGREAIVSDNFEHLESVVLMEFRHRDEIERALRTESNQLELQVLRKIIRYLNPKYSLEQ